MQNFRNYYEILGVARQADGTEIKQAYRKLARQYHPDLNPGNRSAEEQFKLLGEAYEVLSDPERRIQYEKFSQYWRQQGFTTGPSYDGNPTIPQERVSNRLSLEDFNFGQFLDFNSFIDQLLSRQNPSVAYQAAPDPGGIDQGQGRSSGDRRRRDAEANLTIPLEKAFQGGRERIRLEDGRSLEVNMPAGMVTGQRIRLRGQGIGGGNLYLRIEVEPHPFFELQGSDILCRLPITPSEAALGSTIEVPTLDGSLRTTLPQGAQTGRLVRLVGRGYPIGQGQRGDLLLELEVVVPPSLSDREKAIYQELRQVETFNPRQNLHRR